MQTYDVIIVGAGGVGSAAAYHLAARGARVLALDRFPPGHARGSSHGQTRVIRLAYCEHPDYVPLLREAYTLWRKLEAASGERLFHEIGLLQVGPARGYVLPGVAASAKQHGLKIHHLAREEAMARFPGLSVPEGQQAIFEEQAGYLLVERCVELHWQLAAARGATLRVGAAVEHWEATRNGVLVQAGQESYAADRLIIAAGAWANSLLSPLGIPFEVRRKHLHWYATDDERYLEQNNCPVFLFEMPLGIFYGFPAIDARGVKVAQHSGGQAITDPLQIDRRPDEEDRRRVEQFLRKCLPGVSSHSTDHTVCLYTMSPDEHFVVDQWPDLPQVCFVAGLSGHGFKFTSVLGTILADLALDGHTKRPINFLSCSRPALRRGG